MEEEEEEEEEEKENVKNNDKYQGERLQVNVLVVLPTSLQASQSRSVSSLCHAHLWSLFLSWAAVWLVSQPRPLGCPDHAQ